MLLSARGDNGTQMAGVTWRSRLSLRDVTLFDSLGQAQLAPNGKPRSISTLVLNGIYAAIWAGDRIINLSLGLDTTAAGVAPGAMKVSYLQFSDAVRRGVSNWNTLATDTALFVVAAGNNQGADPLFSYFPVLSDGLPNHTIVVTASNQTPGGSVYDPPAGSLIAPTIAAPGANVWSMGQTGTISGTGTSFAAPLVSGVAALVMAFDPRLRADSVRRIVLGGAQRGGRRSGSLYVANAYESLRLAAAQSGAPLCGNRLWVANRQVIIERGSTPQPIPITLPSDSIWGLEAAHGGKRIDYEFPGGQGSLLWTPTGWTAGPSTSVPAVDRSGTGRSVVLESHGGDSLISVVVAQDTGFVGVSLSLFSNFGFTPLRTTTITLPGLKPPPAPNWSEREWVYVSGAYPMNGGDAIIAVNRDSASNTTWLSSCPNGASATCTPGAVFYRYHWVPKQVDLYRVTVNAAPMIATHFATIRDTSVYDIAFSEDGKEKLMRIGRDTVFEDSQAGHYFAGHSDCKVTWSKPTFGATAFTTLFDSAAARLSKDVDGCYSDVGKWYRRGVGTSAPRVAPGPVTSGHSR